MTLKIQRDGVSVWDYVHKGNYEAALEHFQLSAARTNPRSLADAHFMCQAFCYWFLGCPNEAVAILRHAVIAPYTSSGNGARPIALLLYAGERLRDKGVCREAMALLRKHARRAHHGAASSLVPYLLGAIEEQEFRKHILTTPLGDRDQCVCEFIVGLHSLREGNRERFAAQMRAGANAPEESSLLQAEYYLAQWEVENSFPERVRPHRWWEPPKSR
jgi:hypothetical protein